MSNNLMIHNVKKVSMSERNHNGSDDCHPYKAMEIKIEMGNDQVPLNITLFSLDENQINMDLRQLHLTTKG